MNTQPEKNDKPEKRGETTSVWRAIPRNLWHLLAHNFGWKLLALLLALCLWAGLITQDPTLTRERVFADAPVAVTGSDTLRRNGLIVVDGLEGDETARLRVDVPQREYNTVTPSTYNPRVDLTKVTETGAQTVKLTATSTTTYGTVKEIYPDTIDIVVDEYATNYRVPVTLQIVGEYPEGFYGSTPSTDPSIVSISGPRGVVERIARVCVTFDVSRLPAQAGLVRTSTAMSFLDYDGNLVESDQVDVTSAGVLLRSIVVEQQLYETRLLTVNTAAITTGIPATGYEVKSVIATPATLLAAGDPTGLEALDALFVDDPVDVTGLTESFTAEVRVRKPSELLYLSTDTVTLFIEIGPKISTRDFDDIKLVFPDATEGQQVSANVKTVNVSVSGPNLLLKAMRPSVLTACVSVAGLEPGTYDLPVTLRIENIDESALMFNITPPSVSVTIAK